MNLLFLYESDHCESEKSIFKMLRRRQHSENGHLKTVGFSFLHLHLHQFFIWTFNKNFFSKRHFLILLFLYQIDPCESKKSIFEYVRVIIGSSRPMGSPFIALLEGRLGSHTDMKQEVDNLVGSLPTLTKEFPDVCWTFTHAQNN